jgi:hypothetical protein
MDKSFNNRVWQGRLVEPAVGFGLEMKISRSRRTKTVAAAVRCRRGDRNDKPDSRKVFYTQHTVFPTPISSSRHVLQHRNGQPPIGEPPRSAEPESWCFAADTGIGACSLFFSSIRHSYLYRCVCGCVRVGSSHPLGASLLSVTTLSPPNSPSPVWSGGGRIRCDVSGV